MKKRKWYRNKKEKKQKERKKKNLKLSGMCHMGENPMHRRRFGTQHNFSHIWSKGRPYGEEDGGGPSRLRAPTLRVPPFKPNPWWPHPSGPRPFGVSEFGPTPFGKTSGPPLLLVLGPTFLILSFFTFFLSSEDNQNGSTRAVEVPVSGQADMDDMWMKRGAKKTNVKRQGS